MMILKRNEIDEPICLCQDPHYPPFPCLILDPLHFSLLTVEVNLPVELILDQSDELWSRLNGVITKSCQHSFLYSDIMVEMNGK